ncbi:MAG: M20 family metallopeptidase [Ruminococcaceae bacterium]|nr:M20 family metallopeptidase [Oscillospiraceae bacterium]
MVCNEVFETVDKLNDTYIKVWEDVGNIESPTNFKEGVDAVGAYFIAKAEKLGFKVEVFRQEVSGDVVCITMNPDSSLAPLCISGHIDTVHPVGMFGTPAVHLDSEKIYGPGVNDCKGGVVAGFFAMHALKECGFTKRPVMLLLQTDEECGSMQSNKATINYICEKAKNAVAFLNLEGYKPGRAVLVRKGILSFRFDVTGKAGHASRCANEGASAIAAAAHKIIELEKLKDDDGITCSCGIIKGGSAVNTIPCDCSFSVNFRFATQEQRQWIINYVQELADREDVIGTSCTVTMISSRLSMEKNERNLQLLKRVNEIFAENGIQTLEGKALRGGSDAAEVTAAGIPCMDSLGTDGSGSHSINEHSLLSSLAESAKRIVAIACSI